MAKLINGNGNPAVYAAQDADLIASICGDTTCIAAVGSEYAATQEDANTIGLADGVIITKEGRRIQLDAGYTDLFTIPTGTAGTTSYYIIGYKLKTESDSRQTCETFVQKMNSSSATIPEDTFRGGASEVYVSVYRVTQNGLNIQTIAKLLPTLAIGSTVSSHTGSGSTVTNTIAAGKNLDEVTQTLLNNDYKINSDFKKYSGLGLKESIDLNDVKESCSFIAQNNCTNLPSAHQFIVNVFADGNGGCVQQANRVSDDTLFYRRFDGSAWSSSWKQTALNSQLNYMAYRIHDITWSANTNAGIPSTSGVGIFIATNGTNYTYAIIGEFNSTLKVKFILNELNCTVNGHNIFIPSAYTEWAFLY